LHAVHRTFHETDETGHNSRYQDDPESMAPPSGQPQQDTHGQTHDAERCRQAAALDQYVWGQKLHESVFLDFSFASPAIE
jgi:hypothetical protein